MRIFLLILFGAIGGVFGGMGMGGGTLLVPLLSILNIPQINMQGIVLVSFVPMSIVAIILHSKAKRIKYRCWWVIIPAVIASVVASIFAHQLSNKVLTIIFAVMLLAIGIWQLVVAIVAIRNPTKKALIVVRCDNGALRAKGKTAK